jgi:N-acetylneuraminic acid mutarotase
LAATALAGTAATWVAGAPLPSRRADFAYARVGRYIFAAGGCELVAGCSRARVDGYDAVADAWVPFAPLPGPRLDTAASAGGDGRLYVLGGQVFDGHWHLESPSVVALDPATNTWSTVPDLPVGREALGAAEGTDGRVYAIGGASGGVATADVEAYAPATGTWSQVAPLPTPRYALVVVAAGRRIYAISGEGNGFKAENEAYNPTTNRWQERAPIPVPVTGAAGSVGPDGTVYVLGGCSASECPTALVQVYSPATNSWTTGPSLSVARAALGAALGADGRVRAFGGTIVHRPGGKQTNLDEVLMQ